MLLYPQASFQLGPPQRILRGLRLLIPIMQSFPTCEIRKYAEVAAAIRARVPVMLVWASDIKSCGRGDMKGLNVYD